MKRVVLIAISFILFFIPFAINQFYLGIDLLIQIALLLVFPILGLTLSVTSVKKTKGYQFLLSLVALVINALEIIITLIFLFLSI